jgi:hypothetical protein
VQKFILWFRFSRLERWLFFTSLLPGASWGLLGIALASQLPSMVTNSRFGEWDIARPWIIIGMTLGVASSSVVWHRRVRRDGSSVVYGLFWSLCCVAHGIVWGALGVGLVAVGRGLLSKPMDGGSAMVLVALPLGVLLVGTIGLIFGSFYAIVTVLPVGLLVFPLTEELWRRTEAQHLEPESETAFPTT